jgi:hypothetical protein
VPASLLRQLQPSEVVCPAGELAGDADVRCKIEQHTLRGHEEPQSIEGFCCGEYAACSTWLAAKKVEEKGGDLRRILDAQREEDSRRRTATALREARLRRAQRLMVEDSPEGREFRRKLKVGEFDPDVGGR